MIKVVENHVANSTGMPTLAWEVFYRIGSVIDIMESA